MTEPNHTTPVGYYHGGGDDIPRADYRRWIEQGAEAYHCLDANFRDGGGADPDIPEDQQDQFSDLLCQLMHFAQAVGFDFDEELRRARNNYDAERHPDPLPKWATTILKRKKEK
jgi:hypothetical protein